MANAVNSHPKPVKAGNASPAVGKTPTLKDIARAAGVSVWLASSVLNNRQEERRIAPQSAEKVLGIAASMGYIPNVGARQLRKNGGQGQTVVLAIITSLQVPFSLTDHFIRCLHELSLRADSGVAMDVALAVELFDMGELSKLKGLLAGDRFNAAIITNTNPEDDAFLEANRLPYPVVIANRRVPGYFCTVESAKIGENAARLLCDAGSRHPVLLQPKMKTQSMVLRSETFISALAALLGDKPTVVRTDDFSAAAAERAIGRYLRRGGRIDGLFCLTDNLALGAYHALKSAGLRIPKDVAVVGIGDDEGSPYFDPPLSSVGVAPEGVGNAISELLRDQLEGREITNHIIEMPVRMAVRASSQRKASR